MSPPQTMVSMIFRSIKIIACTAAHSNAARLRGSKYFGCFGIPRVEVVQPIHFFAFFFASFLPLLSISR